MRAEAKALPAGFLDRLKEILPPQKFDEAVNTFIEPKPTSFRANTLKAAPAEIRERLEHAGFSVEPVRWYPAAFLLRRGTLRDLQEEPMYARGEIYVQALSSMLPPLALNPQPGEEILDLTAAPGSKTTQIAAMMKGQGKILANDNDKVRFFKLKANVENQGASNVELTLYYGESFGRYHPERFDRVLLDAPCSAEGRFLVREPKSFGFWKPAKVKEMARKQRKLLFSALHALKVGGLLVYSTCTYAPEENEGIVSWALEKFEGAVQMEEIRLPLTNQMPGLVRWGKEGFDLQVRRAVRILPNAQMEGFFVAAIRKTASRLERQNFHETRRLL